MANQRAKNNKAVFETVPESFVPKNEKTGEIVVGYDEFALDSLTSPADGDVVFCMEIPSFHKVKSVRLFNLEGIASGSVSVGYSSNLELGDREEKVAAVADAFIATTAINGINELSMGVDAAGFLSERERPVFLTVTLGTAPTVIDGKKIQVLLETVGK